MNCRSFQLNESSRIETLFLSTFTASEGKAEGKLIANLVRQLISDTDEKDLQGFVSTDEDKLAGAIFFSRLSFEENLEAMMLSPVAVHSDYQRKGVGQELINYGLQELKKVGIELVITYGDPAFYSKVGFSALSEEVLRAPFELSHSEGWLSLSLSGEPLTANLGQSKCVRAFNNPAYW